MHTMHIRDFDLNLLCVLDALLEEQSVSRAARRLRMKQPAVSQALGRLRTQLGDPLLVRAGTKMVLSAKAVSLQSRVSAAMQSVHQVLHSPADTRPESQQRDFVIATTDYALTLILPDAISRLSEVAPGFRIVARSGGDDVPAALERSEYDLALMPKHKVPLALRQRRLLEDDFVCIASSKNPIARRALTVAALVAARHVAVAVGNRSQYPTDPLDQVLEGCGAGKRHVAVSVSGFVSAASIVASTNLIAVVPRLLAEKLTATMNLRPLEIPLPVPKFSYCLVWHERCDRDLCHALLRRQFRSFT